MHKFFYFNDKNMKNMNKTMKKWKQIRKLKKKCEEQKREKSAERWNFFNRIDLLQALYQIVLIIFQKNLLEKCVECKFFPIYTKN